MTRFATWSRQVGKKPVIWPKRQARLGISVRLIPACYLWVPIHLEQGEPDADIHLDRAYIRHPDPFDQHGLTDACRAFITKAVQHAVENDGHQRSITWPDPPLHHHGGQHD